MGRPCKLIVILVIVKGGGKIYYEVYLEGFEHSTFITTLSYPRLRRCYQALSINKGECTPVMGKSYQNQAC